VGVTDRFKSAWNAFSTIDDAVAAQPLQYGYGDSFSLSPSRPRIRMSTERTIIAAIYARLSVDVSMVAIRHVRHDNNDRYIEDIYSGLNNCLTVEANLDQGAQAFRQDIAFTLIDNGVAAIVPVDTTLDPTNTDSYDIRTLRVGNIVQWYPKHVRVSLYNENLGRRQEITLEKRFVAIVENPLYTVMNEPNSTLQRLIRKLNLLDSVDEQSSSGKLDMIIQLPYVIKSEARREQAEQRRTDIEMQLKGSKYGIAYTDGTEKITQLNRPAENNLMGQIEYLTTMLYAQLGLTPEVMNGTADEATMLNYYNRTVNPIMGAITEAMKRTFLTKTARSQRQSIDYFRDPFKLVPISQVAEISDKLARNEIMTSNEIRQILGFKPSSDPKADQLINSNMPVDDTGVVVDPNAPAPDPNAPAPAPDPNAPASSVAAPAPVADTTPLDNMDAQISAAFSAFGGTPAASLDLAPPSGDMDPSVMLSSLDELDKAIDDAFSGLGLDD
jgi:hypothetical protein